MVHPGIIAASVLGVVVTGVVIYTILKDEISDMLTSFEKQSPVGAGGGSSQRERRGSGSKQENNDDDYYRGQSSSSSSMYDHHFTDYELRQRRTRSNGNNHDEDEDEKDFDHDMMTERFRRINETEREIAANEARLADMERSMKEREEALQESIRQREARMEQAMREAEEQFARQDQERAALLNHHHLQQQQQVLSAELYQNPFASSHDLHQQPTTPPPANNNAAATVASAATSPVVAAAALAAAASSSEVDPRPANAILRHDLSNNHQVNVNPFEDPSSLLENASSSPSSSRRSSIHGADEDDHIFADADDRSVTIGRDSDDEELDWTEAEIGSIGSHDSEDSWSSS
ncbi:hypothetical protein K457DRAFT_135489 [Linnemannia elongata AG-77]|uniref:Uncharacterized protein n=1 Tax=Linnemannia elongata AG-77 TaxID=1314771 RepID=A0A197K627_9FUNG|nr:hypothetical protein K457DRAFT_135489 [Linnemannia elongata AG-77]